MPLKPKYNSNMILDVLTTDKQSLKQIADKVGCNKETIKNHIKPLIKNGLVVEIKESYQNETGYTYRYFLNK